MTLDGNKNQRDIIGWLLELVESKLWSLCLPHPKFKQNLGTTSEDGQTDVQYDKLLKEFQKKLGSEVLDRRWSFSFQESKALYTKMYSQVRIIEVDS